MKTFLLGSAAALGFGGVAQAADLSVSYAEPVDYVRVCDAFGAGFYYIPGTDTCLRIGGYVRFQVEYGSENGDPAFNIGVGDPGSQPTVDELPVVVEDDDELLYGTAFVYGSEPEYTHDSDWIFKSRGSIDITASSMTDWGPLVGYVEFEANFGAGDGDVSWAEPSNMFLSLGPFMAGMYQSNFDTGGSYTSAYQLDDGFNQGFTDDKVLQLQLSWAFNGFGIILAAEDPHKRVDDWEEYTSTQGDIPDLVAALTGEWGNVAGKVAFLYRDTSPDSSYGVQGNVELSDLFGGLDILLAGFWIDEGAGRPGGNGDVWGGQGSVRYDWNSQWRSAFTAQYVDYSATGGTEGWNFAVNNDYKPVEDFMIRLGGRYYDETDEWRALIEFRRSFGG
jgi:Porin subfamily